MPAKIVRTPCELVYHSLPPGTYTVKIWGAGGGGSQGDQFAYGGGGGYQELTFTTTSFKIATTYIGRGGTQGNVRYVGRGGCGGDTAGDGGTYETFSGGGGGGSSWFSLGGFSVGTSEIKFISAGGGGAGANGNQISPAATGGNNAIISTGGVGGYFNGKSAINAPASTSGGGGGGGKFASGGGGGKNYAPSSVDIIAQGFTSFSYVMTLTTTGNSGASGGTIFSGNIGLPGNYLDEDRGETTVILQDGADWSAQNIKNVKVIGGPLRPATVWIHQTAESIDCDINVIHLILDENLANLQFLQRQKQLLIRTTTKIVGSITARTGSKLTTIDGTYGINISNSGQIIVGSIAVSSSTFAPISASVQNLEFKSKSIYFKPNMNLRAGLSNIDFYNASSIPSLSNLETVLIAPKCFNTTVNRYVDRVSVPYLTSDLLFKQAQRDLLEVYVGSALVLKYTIKSTGNELTTLNGTYNLSLGAPSGTYDVSMFINSVAVSSTTATATSASPNNTSVTIQNIYLRCNETVQTNIPYLTFHQNNVGCTGDNTVYVGNSAYNTIIDQYVAIVKITERMFDLTFRKFGNQLVVHKRNDINTNPIVLWTMNSTPHKIQFIDGELEVFLSGSDINLGGQNVVTGTTPTPVTPIVPFGSTNSIDIQLTEDQIFKAMVPNLNIFGKTGRETVVINRNATNISCDVNVINVCVQYKISDLLFLQQGVKLLIYYTLTNKLISTISVRPSSSYLTTIEGKFEIRLSRFGKSSVQILLAGDPVHPAVPSSIQGRQRLDNLGSNIITLDDSDRYIVEKSDTIIQGYTDGSGWVQILKNMTNIIVPLRTRQVSFEYNFNELKFKQTGVQLLVSTTELIATINMASDISTKITSFTGSAIATLNAGTLAITIGGAAIGTSSPSIVVPLSFSKNEVTVILPNSIISDGQGGLGEGGNGRISIISSENVFSYKIAFGRERKIIMYNGFKTMIARLRQNGFSGSILANSQIVTVHGQGLSSISNNDFYQSQSNFHANTKNYEGSIGSNIVVDSSRLTTVKSYTKQFIVKLRRGSFSGPVVATSQIVDILNLGNKKFENINLQDGKTKFEVVTGTDSKAIITKTISNVGYVRMTTTSTTSTSTSTSTTTSTSTSTSTTSTSTSTTSTSTSTTTIGPSTSTSSSTSTTTSSPTSTTTSTSTSTSTSTTTLPKTTSTTTNLFYSITPSLNGRNCFVVGEVMIFEVQSVFANKTFFIQTSGTAKSTPLSAGPLVTNSLETSPGSGRYAASFNLEATAIGLLDIILIPADTLSPACAITVCIVQITSTTTSTSTTSTTTTQAPPVIGQHTSTSTTSTTTSATPYSGTTLSFPL